MSAGLSPAANRLLNVFVSGGAAIVIVGALFKIQHWPGASFMLILGTFVVSLKYDAYTLTPRIVHINF